MENLGILLKYRYIHDENFECGVGEELDNLMLHNNADVSELASLILENYIEGENSYC